MYVRHSITRLLLGLCFLALAPFQVAHAGFNGRWDTGYRVDWETGVTHTNSTWIPGGSPSSGNTRWGVEGGLPVAKSAGRLPIGKGVIDVEAKVLPNRPSVAGAIGRLGRRLGPWAKVAAFADFAIEIGHIMNDDGDLERLDPTVCTVAPCYEYANSLFDSSMWFPTAQQAADRALGKTWYGQPICSAVVVSGTYFKVIYGSSCQSETGLYNLLTRSKTPSSNPYVPSSWEEFETAIANKTDWSPTSKLPDVIKQAADSGEPIDASSPTITGPTSVVGPTSTTTNPDGTTITKTEIHNITYNGNQITYNTTIVTNNNGQITTEVKDPEPSPDQCAQYPDSLACSSLGNADPDQLDRTDHVVTVTPVTFASSAGCPAPLTFNVGPSAYSISYQPTCDRLALLRVLFLAIAAVLAAFILADSFRIT